MKLGELCPKAQDRETDMTTDKMTRELTMEIVKRISSRGSHRIKQNNEFTCDVGTICPVGGDRYYVHRSGEIRKAA